MQQPQRRIFNLGQDTIATFQALNGADWINYDDDADIYILKDKSMRLERRFLNWAQDVRLMDYGHDALDYRLRDSPDLGDAVIGLIRKINHVLCKFTSTNQDDDPTSSQRRMTPKQNGRLWIQEYTHGNDDKNEWSGAPGLDARTEPSSDDGRSDDTSDVDMSYDSSPVEKSFEEFDQSLDSMATWIDSLYEVSVRLQRCCNLPRRSSEDLYDTISADQKAHAIRAHCDFETSLVVDMTLQQVLQPDSAFRKLSEGRDWDRFLEKYCSTGTWLLRRTGIANAQRRQRLVYWRNDSLRLDHYVRMKSLSMNAEGTDPGSRRRSSSAMTGSTLESYNKARSGSISEPAAFPPRPRRDHQGWPLAPSNVAGSDYFHCPYCYFPCPQRYLSQDIWRLHLMNDLEPYHCTYENCMSPQVLYTSPQEWVAHEEQHRKVWRCMKHGLEFASRSSYVLHLKTSSKEHKLEEESEEMVAAAIATSWRANRQCPFCYLSLESAQDMQMHIREHLERYTLNILDSFEAFYDGPSIRRPLPTQRMVAKEIVTKPIEVLSPRSMDDAKVIPEIKETPEEEKKSIQRGSLVARKAKGSNEKKTDGEYLCLLAAYTGCNQRFSHLSQAKRHVEQHHILHEYWLCTLRDCRFNATFQHDFLDPQLSGNVFFRPDNFRSHLHKMHMVLDRKEQKAIEERARVLRCPLPSSIVCPSPGCGAACVGGKPLSQLFIHMKKEHFDELSTLGSCWESTIYDYLLEYKILVKEEDGKVRAGNYKDIPPGGLLRADRLGRVP